MRLFWIVTLTWATPSGQATSSASGTLTTEQVAILRTRTAAVPAVVDAARRGMGIPDGQATTTLFISIEPDALAADLPANPATGEDGRS
jgi:hypothetical protein